ncbi:MAG: TolC family protein [Chromatiaceae bacterium]|jgi:cobalt-zinc-cadmium efflux system outer membrane protein|nr:TolC family protein [Chromatiaceae bacterium]
MRFIERLGTLLVLIALPIGSLCAQAPSDAASGAMTLADALQRAVAAEPRLQLNATRAEAAEGRIEQANLRPNPVIGVEAENFLGTGPLSGVQGLEITIGISQVIETAGKRVRRTGLARAERALLDWDRQTILAELEASVRAAFVEVLLAQQRLQLREEQLALAERSAAETSRLVEAARSPEVERTRAQLAVREQAFAVQQAARRLATAKSVLASFWGGAGETGFSVVGRVRLDPELPSFDQLAAQLADTAALARYSAQERVREAALDLEMARAKPDVEVFAGTRYFNERDGDVAFLVGVEVPWTLFDLNQGNIRSARAELKAVSDERDAIHRERVIELNRAYQQAQGAQAEAHEIQSQLLPAADATLRATEEGYQRGQFNQLAVLESRSALFRVRETYLDALRRYSTAQADIEALTRPATLQSQANGAVPSYE